MARPGVVDDPSREPFVLASASPRRRELLRQVGLRFEIIASRHEPDPQPGEDPARYALRSAAAKAEDVCGRVARANAWVLGADTVVVHRDEALTKPRHAADARRMLARLADDWHTVVTAVVLSRPSHGVCERLCASTRVRVAALSSEAIARYVQSGEGHDKAGGYGIQGVGAGFITRVEGCYFNVVGLPLADTLQLLLRHGVIAEWPLSALARLPAAESE